MYLFNELLWLLNQIQNDVIVHVYVLPIDTGTYCFSTSFTIIIINYSFDCDLQYVGTL